MRAPPSASFGNISAKNQATKPALKPNWAPGFDTYCCHAPLPISPVCISTGISSTGLCWSGGATIKRVAAAARRRRQNHATISVGDDEGSGGAQGRQRLRDKEGSGGATMKGAAAPQGRQRLRDKEGSGGATTKAEPCNN
jgi:hypothetical protein